MGQANHKTDVILLTLPNARRPQVYFPDKCVFSRVAKDNPNCSYVASASDSAPDDGQGERGRVDAEMVKKYVPDLNRPIYYLSGPQGMVKAMRQLLVDLKVNEDNIRTQEFSGY